MPACMDHVEVHGVSGGWAHGVACSGNRLTTSELPRMSRGARPGQHAC